MKIVVVWCDFLTWNILYCWYSCLQIRDLYDVPQIRSAQLLQISRRYYSKLLTIRVSKRERLWTGISLNCDILRHRRCRLRCSNRGSYLYLLQLTAWSYYVGHLRHYCWLCLDDVGNGRCCQLHGEMYRLVNGLTVAGRDRHLDWDCLLHRELNHLWYWRPDSHALSIR